MQRPNIVFVFADQMRASTLGCLGLENVQTPNLDRFAGEGTQFTRAISNHPVCGPARASLLTGLHSIHHGLVTNDQQLRTDLPTLAHNLNDIGYKCGYVGKWHIDCLDRGAFIPAGPRRRGFDDLWAVNNCNHEYLNAYYYLNDNPEPVWIDGYEPDAQTDIAVHYIHEKTQEDAPFCLFLSWGPPHCPYEAVPQHYLDMYPPETINLKPNAVETADKKLIAGYYAHITALDACFGRVLDTIEKCGIGDNTIVVFTSDHGDMLFSQNRGWKMKPWAESVNIPFLVRWPGCVPAGRRCDAPIGLVDVMPTLTSLTGAAAPNNIDGADLSALFCGDESNMPVSQLIGNIVNYEGWSRGYAEWRGVVTRSYTYARLRDCAWLLYNDTEDPDQLANLVGDAEHTEVRNKLDAELKRWLDATGDPFYSSDEAVERYVVGKIVVSEDQEELASYLVREFSQVHQSVPNIQEIAAEVVLRPDQNRFVRCFENHQISQGRTGAGRKLHHHEIFPH